MASFEIRWKRSAAKELKKLPQPVVGRILLSVAALAENPIPPNAVKLSGAVHTYRLRIGDYRLIYDVLSRVLTIEVIRVGHRKDVYRKLP